MEKKNTVEMLAFTDPVCTWCWGSKPVVRKLETWYGEHVRIRYVMGGLVKDIRDFYDRANDIGGDPERSNLQIARQLAGSFAAPRDAGTDRWVPAVYGRDNFHISAKYSPLRPLN